MDNNLYYGTVIWFKKTFGFLSWTKSGVQQKDMFVFYCDITMENENTYKTLKPGQKVSFGIGTNHHGQPKAVNVKIIS